MKNCLLVKGIVLYNNPLVYYMMSDLLLIQVISQ